MSDLPARIVVIGAGISGLAAAHFIRERAKGLTIPPEIVVWEASSRAGGVISTMRRDGFLVEAGPDSLFSLKPEAETLCRQVGLGPQIIGTRPEHRRSFVLRGNTLHPVPDGYYLLAPAKIMPFLRTPLFTWGGKVRILCDLFIPRARGNDDESFGHFVRRRFGDQALERLAQPMVSAVYASDPDALSLKSVLPQFIEMEERRGSVIRALMLSRAKRQDSAGPRYGLFITLRSGLQSLTDTLAQRLNGRIQLNTPVTGVSFDPQASPSQRWIIRAGTGREQRAAALCVALPGPAAASIFGESHPGLSRLLNEIPYRSSATIHVAYPQEAIRHPMDGFGFVVPSAENRSLLACTFSHRKYEDRAPARDALLRLFLSGEAAEAADEPATQSKVISDLRRILGIRIDPLWVTVHRHPLSMAQYLVGHAGRQTAIEREVGSIPGLALAGNAYRGIGVPDCIRSASLAADNVLNYVSRLV
ncbi:MAG TPA: protoporphyrinogen oxidase [Elusimicrobiota bacterium]|nr:protoporphyrinogen oxidase [Elusimicrobiota bacterium]